ncbi:IS110 family transposase [Mesorhizobium sp. SB112]|uniref:IS110 family transposase n=1 Tax=Mesorhizobium sp. SB112 TaxID=3151853 RepID=UPI0032664D09
MTTKIITCMGIDVSKAFLDVAFLDATLPGSRQVTRYSNDVAGVSALAAAFDGSELVVPDLVIIEATGGYELICVRVLQAQGWPVAVVNPRQVRDFARAQGQLAKTDALDARLLASFGLAMQPAVLAPFDPSRDMLAALVARRRQLIDMAIAEKNRKEQAAAYPSADKTITGSIDAILSFLKSQLISLDTSIALAVAADPHMAAAYQRLTQVPGIGAVTAAIILAELPELGHIDHKKIAALVGVAPINRDSGRHRGERHIGGGRHSVRCALYMATISGVRCNPQLTEFYKRLKANGKPSKLALIATLRKLTGILNAIMRKHIQETQQQYGC